MLNENLDIYKDLENLKNKIENLCMVSKDIQKERLSVCEICLRNDDMVCLECGCDIQKKSLSKNFKCKFWKK